MSNSNLSITISQTNLSVKMYQRGPKGEGTPQGGNTGDFLRKASDNDYDVGFVALIDDDADNTTQVLSSQKTNSLVDAINDVLNKKPTLGVTKTTVRAGSGAPIDDALGTVATAGEYGYIEDEKFGRSYREVSWGGTAGEMSFDDVVTRTGKRTLKMKLINTTSTSGQIQVSNYFASLDGSEKYLIPIVGGKTYRIGYWYKKNMTSQFGSSDGFRHQISTFDDALVLYDNIAGAYSNGVADWQYQEIVLTANANATKLSVNWRIEREDDGSEVWIDLNSLVVEQIENTTNDDQVGVQDAISTVEAVSDLTKVDTENPADNSTFTFGRTTVNKIAQSMIFTKRNISGFTVRKGPSGGNFVDDLVCHVRTDNGDEPHPTHFLAKYTIPNAVWEGLANDAEFYIPLPFNANIGEKYWLEIERTGSISGTNLPSLVNSTTGGLTGYGIKYHNGTAWTNSFWTAFDLTFKTHYVSRFQGIKVSDSVRDIELKAVSADGILGGSIIDVVNEKYTWSYDYLKNNVFTLRREMHDLLDNNGARLKRMLYTGSGGQGQRMILTHSGNDANQNLIMKWDFGAPTSGPVNFTIQKGGDETRTALMAYSTDGEEWTIFSNRDVKPSTVDHSFKLDIDGSQILYIKIYSVAGGYWYLHRMIVEADLNLGPKEIPQSYPTGKTQTETMYKELTEATTTLTYRKNKYGDPAIEFADGVFEYLPFDIYGATTVSLTAYDENATELATGSIVNDGDSLTIASEDILYLIFDFVLTTNTLRAQCVQGVTDGEYGCSFEAILGILRKSQGLYYDVLDLKKETPPEEKDDIDYVKSEDTGWITATMLNSWIPHSSSYQTPRYRKVGGVVYVEGMVKSGTSGTLLQLPVGMRPSKRQIHAQISNGASYRLDVHTDGILQGSGYNASWVSIDLSFYVG